MIKSYYTKALAIKGFTLLLICENSFKLYSPKGLCNLEKILLGSVLVV